MTPSTGSITLITIYFAIMFINPSDVVSLAHSSIIITAILSKIFLKEKLTIAHLIALILTVIGVLFISKPSFLFPKETFMLNSLNMTNINCTQSQTNCLNTISPSQSYESLKLTIGITLTFLGAFSSSVVFLVIKKLCNSKVHWATSTIFVCWFGLPFSLIISAVLVKFEYFHTDLRQERKDLPMDIFYSVLASLLSVLGQILLNISLKYEDATKIAITKTIDVFFSFVLQFFLLNILIDAMSIVGAVFILAGTFFVLIFKILENRYDNFKKKQQIENKNQMRNFILKLIFVKF